MIVGINVCCYVTQVRARLARNSLKLVAFVVVLKMLKDVGLRNSLVIKFVQDC